MEFLLNSSSSHPSIELDLPAVEKIVAYVIYLYISMWTSHHRETPVLRTNKEWRIVGSGPKKLSTDMDSGTVQSNVQIQKMDSVETIYLTNNQGSL